MSNLFDTVRHWPERMGVKIGDEVMASDAFPYMKEEILERRAAMAAVSKGLAELPRFDADNDGEMWEYPHGEFYRVADIEKLFAPPAAKPFVLDESRCQHCGKSWSLHEMGVPAPNCPEA